MTTEPKSAKNIYLYIIVIFACAVALILASKLVQSNISVNTSLTANVAQLSEDNLNLQTEIKAVQEQNTALTDEKDALAESVGKKEGQLENYEYLFEALNLYNQKKYQNAFNSLTNVSANSLTADALSIYNTLKQNLEKQIR